MKRGIVMSTKKKPKLPQLLDRKIYKSGQTRGADDDEIYQNRVGRTSTVLIPFQFWDNSLRELVSNGFFEAGYIVLVKPEEYFSKNNPSEELKKVALTLGENALVFYETRTQWNDFNPEELKWEFANSRTSPLGGKYIARIPATTAVNDGGRIIRGFSETSMKGAGIRLYEYATIAIQQISKTRNKI